MNISMFKINLMEAKKLDLLNPTTQHNVHHLPFPVAFSCETNRNGDYVSISSLLIQ